MEQIDWSIFYNTKKANEEPLLPEKALPVCAMVIIQYVDENGKKVVDWTWRSESAQTLDMIGMLEVCKLEVYGDVANGEGIEEEGGE